MNEHDQSQWRELAWRSKLSDEQAAALQKLLNAHPDASEEWRQEVGLNELLERLPEAPAVSSNFTALVLQAVERDAATREREQAKHGFVWQALRGWLPKVAVACVAVVFTLGGYQHYEARNRAVFARDVAAVSSAVSADPELVKDVEPIILLNDPDSKADTELLALMK